jgi:MFS family permease
VAEGTGERGVPRDVLTALSGVVAASFPLFLVSALAVQLRQSLGFGPSGLGIVISLFFVAAALGSVPLGALTERLGAVRVMRLACGFGGTSLVLVATVVDSLSSLAMALVIAGVASAAMELATNQFLAYRVPTARQGMAFGAKQAAVPFAATLAGLAIPGVVVLFGWRSAFWVAAAITLVIFFTLSLAPDIRRAYRRPARTALPGGSVLVLGVLAVGAGLGVAAATALTSFLAISMFAAGVDETTVGWLIALGGVLACVSRVLSGIGADRRGRNHLVVVAVMLGVGGLGIALISVSVAGAVQLLIPAIVLAFAAGWGWNGLFNLAVISNNRDHPARATGITQLGSRIGGVLGPLLFGLAADAFDYSVAWLGTAVVAMLGAGVMLLGRRMLRKI